ncbi:hypothetical protein ABPG72_020729 [Tetrahymena utriculariae]
MKNSYSIKYIQLLDFIRRSKQQLGIPQNLIDSLQTTQEVLTFLRFQIFDNFNDYVDTNPQFDQNNQMIIEFNNSLNWSFEKKNKEVEDWHIIFGTSQFLGSVSPVDQAYTICQQFPLIKYLVKYIERENNSHNFDTLLDKEQKNFYCIFIQNIVDFKSQFFNIFSIRPLAMENIVSYNQSILKIQITLILNCFLKLYNLSDEKQVTINTGFIGCGFYNNNYILMALLQFLIADLVGINKIVFNPYQNQAQAKTAQKIYIMIKNFLKGKKNVKFLSKLLEFLEKINFHAQDKNTQTDDQVLKSAEKYLYLLLESSDEIQNNQHGKYPDLSLHIKQMQVNQNPIQNDQIIMNFQPNQQKEGFQKQDMPYINNNQHLNHAQMMQNQGLLHDQHIFLQSRNIQFNQLNAQQQQNIINQVEQKAFKDDLNSQNLIDPDLRMIIQISKLFQTKLKKLHPNKQFLYDRIIHKQLLSQIEQEILYIRCILNTPYPTDELFINFFQVQKTKIEPIYSEYTYEKNSFNQFQWHVNFADQQIFGFYETSLFAQDEIQTAENPLLYHLREEAIIQSKQNPKLKPLTFEEKNPTPILIINSLREGKINTKPTQNNPWGLYGKNFEKTDFKKIAEACEQIKEEDIIDVNIISMCSLSYQTGYYTQEQIRFTFNTAYKSFREAYITVKKIYSDKHIPIIINTGNWGTGAFGNNSELIVIIQLLAAEISQIDHLKYYTFDEKGQKGFQRGYLTFQQIKKDVQKYQPKSFSQYVDHFLNIVYYQKYEWQVSDGN